jgi:hopanoid biosynthesis associated radical SAM protein HpnH
VFDKAVQAIKAAKAKGFRVTVNATLFGGVDPDRAAAYLDYVTDELKVDGVTLSPGYAYERAPDQEHFLNRQTSKNLFREIFKRGEGRKKKWRFVQSTMFLDFLAGNQDYRCTPWGTPTRNVFGWQRPCYLLNEGYTKTFKELMETTEWDSYGTGVYEKCADCMVHCGYEPTAVNDTVANPLKALKTVLRGIKTTGPMAPEIPLENQRPAEYVFDKIVREVADTTPPKKSARKEQPNHAA